MGKLQDGRQLSVQFKLYLSPAGTRSDHDRLDQRSQHGPRLRSELRIGEFLVQASGRFAVEPRQIWVKRWHHGDFSRGQETCLLLLEVLESLLGCRRDYPLLQSLKHGGDPTIDVR